MELVRGGKGSRGKERWNGGKWKEWQQQGQKWGAKHKGQMDETGAGKAEVSLTLDSDVQQGRIKLKM